MAKIDYTVVKETKYIAYFVLLLSIIMQAVFLISGMWDYTVLLGNLLSGVIGILNFFLMGISVQKALQKDEKEAKSIMRISHTYRTLFMLVGIAVGAVLPVFNIWAVVIPVVFPRIAIAFRSLMTGGEKK